MNPWRAFLVLTLLAEPCAARAQDSSVNLGPPQPWIIPLAIDKAPLGAQDSAQPCRWLLHDDQINAQSNERYRQRALQILTSAGVQDHSQIEIEFDPAVETVTFHWIRIWRGGKAIDRMNRDKIRVIQRETDLEEQIFTGQRTALVILDDVRPGDIIDYACTVTGADPYLDGRHFGVIPAQLELPAHRLRTRLLWPPGRPLYFKNHLTDAQPARARRGGLVEFDWEARDVPALRLEPDMPGWFNPRPRVDMGEFRSWPEVSRWATGLFSNTAPLSPDLALQIQQWLTINTQAGRAEAALRFMQDEIRYLSVPSGGSRPAAPNEVFDRRYGDCKDKTLLLVTALRAMGIPSWPVLVNTVRRRGVADDQPTPTAFDHVIVAAVVDGTTCWLDPTATYERGPLSERYHYDYGYGLAARADYPGLVPIPPSGGQPKTTVTEFFQVGHVKEPTSLKVVTVAEGLDAVWTRSRYATTSRDQIANEDLNDFARLYPQIRPGAPGDYQDDEQANRVETTEYYNIDGFWTRRRGEDFYRGRVYSRNLDRALHRPAAPIRSWPLAIDFPVHEIYKATVSLPSQAYPDTADETVRNPAFYFHALTSTPDNLNFALEYEYQSLADWAPADGMADYTRQIRQAIDMLDYEFIAY